MKLNRPLLVALCLILVTGCSKIKIAYNQLDWVLPYYAESYMALSEEQKSYLDREIERILKWHCGTQIAAYAELLREAGSAFQTGQITREELESLSEQVETSWAEILLQASESIGNLLMTANDNQFDALFGELEQRNDKWLKKFRKQTPEELRKSYEERMTDELERWFGPLNSSQDLAVLVWSQKFESLGEEGLRVRKRWQQRLRELIDRRENSSEFLAGVQELFTKSSALRSLEYQRRLDTNREHTIDLLYYVGHVLTPQQRHHLARTVSSISREFDELACNENQPDRSSDEKVARSLR